MKWLRALTNLVMLTAALAGSQAMVFPGFGRGSDVEPGKTVGPVELLTPEGVQIRMNDYARYEATVVLFLSTRDDATDRAADAINTLYAKYEGQNLPGFPGHHPLLYVAIFSKPEESGREIRAYCQERGFAFPPYRDPSGHVARLFDVHVTPESFLLDKTGRIVYRGMIGSPDSKLGLAKALAELMSHRAIATPFVPADGIPIDKPALPRELKKSNPSIEFSSELIFGPIPGFPAHHGSSITEAPNGDLLVIWWGGSYESSDDQMFFLSRRKKGTRFWTPPEVLIQSPGRPPGNGVLLVDGLKRIWIVWARNERSRPTPRGTGWDECRLMYRLSLDNGVTWSEDKLFYHDTLGWAPRNLPITLSDGALLLPLSDERNGHGTDLSFFLATKDNGATWIRSGIMPGGEQPTLIQRADASLLTFMRQYPRILQSESNDGGKTWTLPKPTSLKNPDAAIGMCRLHNGHILLAFDNSETERTPLDIIRSLDEGRTWSSPLHLESNPGEYSYPSVYQTSDGKIHVIYTFRRYSIKHVEMNENWLTQFDKPN